MAESNRPNPFAPITKIPPLDLNAPDTKALQEFLANTDSDGILALYGTLRYIAQHMTDSTRTLYQEALHHPNQAKLGQAQGIREATNTILAGLYALADIDLTFGDLAD